MHQRYLFLGLAFGNFLLAVACATSTNPPSARAPQASGVSAQDSNGVISGVLITKKGQDEIGKETYRDDSRVLQEAIVLAGRSENLTLDRSSNTAKVEVSGTTLVRDIPAGAIALENGSWQSYRIAAEKFAQANTPTPVKVFLPSRGAIADGTISVTPLQTGGQHVDLLVKGLEIKVDIAANGSIVSASVPAQALNVMPATP